MARLSILVHLLVWCIFEECWTTEEVLNDHSPRNSTQDEVLALSSDPTDTSLNMNKTDDEDELWNAASTILKVLGKQIFRMIKPVLDNEIDKESKNSVNKTELEPLNKTLQFHTQQLEYDRASVQLLVADTTSIKGSVTELKGDARKIKKKVDEISTQIKEVQDTVLRVEKQVQNNGETIDSVKTLALQNQKHWITTDSNITNMATNINNMATNINNMATNINNMAANIKEILKWIQNHNKTIDTQV